jgi:hypothetical protein
MKKEQVCRVGEGAKMTCLWMLIVRPETHRQWIQTTKGTKHTKKDLSRHSKRFVRLRNLIAIPNNISRPKTARNDLHLCESVFICGFNEKGASLQGGCRGKNCLLTKTRSSL